MLKKNELVKKIVVDASSGDLAYPLPFESGALADRLDIETNDGAKLFVLARNQIVEIPAGLPFDYKRNLKDFGQLSFYVVCPTNNVKSLFSIDGLNFTDYQTKLHTDEVAIRANYSVRASAEKSAVRKLIASFPGKVNHDTVEEKLNDSLKSLMYARAQKVLEYNDDYQSLNSAVAKLQKEVSGDFVELLNQYGLTLESFTIEQFFFNEEFVKKYKAELEDLRLRNKNKDELKMVTDFIHNLPGGQEVSASKGEKLTCPKCNNPVKATDKYCSCGYKLK